MAIGMMWWVAFYEECTLIGGCYIEGALNGLEAISISRKLGCHPEWSSRHTHGDWIDDEKIVVNAVAFKVSSNGLGRDKIGRLLIRDRYGRWT